MSNESISTFDIKTDVLNVQLLSQLTEKSNNNSSLFNDSASINAASLEYQKDDSSSRRVFNDSSTFKNDSFDNESNKLSKINNSTLDTTVVSAMMSNFDMDTPSTHIFVRPTRGTLNQWEYESRKFLYVSLFKPLINMNETHQKHQRLGQPITFKKICDQYEKITGRLKFPPFFQFDSKVNKYVQMTDNELSEHIKSIVKNISRVKNAINRFVKEGKDNNEKERINEGNNNSMKEANNNNSTIDAEEIVKLSREIAFSISNNERKELLDILTTFKTKNGNKRLKSK